MKTLLQYLKDYKKESILGPLFKLLEACFELMIPLVMAAVIDVGILKQDIPYIYKMCAIMILLGVVGLTASLTAQYFAAKAAVGSTTKLRYSLMERITKFSYEDMDQMGTSALITRMTNDLNQVQSGVNMALRLFLRSPFIVLGAMVMAFTIDVKSALIFVVVIPLLSIVVFGVMKVTMPLYKKVQNALGVLLSKTRENCNGVRVIRAFTMEEEQILDFDEKNDFLAELQKKVGKISALMNPLTYVIINVGLVVLVYSGAVKVYDGVITQGEVVALVNYMSQILVELVKFANCIVMVTKAMASMSRVENVLKVVPSMEKEDIETDSKVEQGKVVFSNVGLTYMGAGKETLQGISFVAKAGDIIGVIGSTGSGKTSLVNLIPRFYDASEGAVYVDGKNVKTYEMDKLRQKMGIVPQKAVLFKGTIRENLLWGNADATEEELWEALELSQAKEIVENKEDGIETMLLASGSNLSGGQRQRLTIARALVRKPEILILDDSASALDFATEGKLRKAMASLSYNPTIFIVSQRISSIQHSDAILVLDDGNLVGADTHEKLLENCTVYKEIYESQTEQKGGRV